MDKWQLAHRLYRPLGWEFLVDPRLRSLTTAELADEKEQRRAPIRLELTALGYTGAEIHAIEEGGESTMLQIDLGRRLAV